MVCNVALSALGLVILALCSTIQAKELGKFKGMQCQSDNVLMQVQRSAQLRKASTAVAVADPTAGNFVKVHGWNEGFSAGCANRGCINSNGFEQCQIACIDNPKCNVLLFCPQGASCGRPGRCCLRECDGNDFKLTPKYKGWDIYAEASDDQLSKNQFDASAANIASAIQSGIQAILGATVHFSAVPPRIGDGISELGTDLFKCVEQLLSQEYKGSQDFVDFKEIWLSTIDNIPITVESIEADIELYIKDGSPPVLIRAIGSIIGETGSIVTSFLPPYAAAEVNKYLDAVTETFRTMGNSWDAFAQGKTVDGIEAIYWGLRDITDGLMSDSLKSNVVYDSITGVLDLVLGNLSKHVLEYERHILESSVCWRKEKNRERGLAEICPANYAWDGEASCYPMIALHGVDASNYGPIPSRCDLNGNYPDKFGKFCYTSCGPGFQLKPDTHERCISACEGNFSAESSGMCGRDAGAITKAIIEMVTVTLNSAFSLADNIIKMKEHGVNGDVLASTIQIFIDMGKPFANPTCPVPELKPIPQPSTELCKTPCAIGAMPGVCRIESGSMVICLPFGANDQCAVGQTMCDPENLTPEPSSPTKYSENGPQCKMGVSIYLSSQRGQQLQDNNGNLGFSPNKQGWEQWKMSDAGDGNVFITSHRKQHLSDHNGHVTLSSGQQGWEKWVVTDADDGTVFLTSHRNQQLQDNNGHARLSWAGNDFERWTLTLSDGGAACTVSPA